MEASSLVSPCLATKELQHFPANIRLAAGVQKHGILIHRCRKATLLHKNESAPLWFAKMSSQARSLRINHIQIEVTGESLRRQRHVTPLDCYMGFERPDGVFGRHRHFDAIESSAYSVSLFTDWQKQRLNEVWIKSRIDEGQAFHAAPEFFGAKLATRNLHPIAELSAENCTEQMGALGPWYERLPHFRMGFTPSAGKELQSEYFVPRQHAIEAILAVERMRDQVSPALLISEIRAPAEDRLWMSSCYEQDCVTIHSTWKPDWPAVSKLLPMIEKELTPFNACPHWGKLFTTSPSELKRIHKKLPEFIELSRKLDPVGKFRNQFLNENVFGS